MSKLHVSLTVNGEPHEFLCEPQQTLLEVLRDELGLTGTKEGCGSGDCGACSIILDGRLVDACQVLAAEAEGRSVTTIEGLAQGDVLHPLQRKFLDHAALQCGFCTPGLLVAAKALLDRNPSPSESEVRFGLAGNLCRCTGYDKIVRAVLDAAAEMRGEAGNPIPVADTGKTAGLRVVGTRPVRPDGVDKVTGRAMFGADMRLPGMLVGRIKRSPHPHARILRIDTSRATSLEGVRAVVTAADFPDLASEEAAAGEGTIEFRDLSANLMARGTALYEGHAVAAVAATTAAIAEAALDLIEVGYEVLPHVIEVEAAMAPDAPLLHEGLFTTGQSPAPTRPSNIASKIAFSLGDAATGFAEAEVVVELRTSTPIVHQGYIEPHACVASWGAGGQCEIYSSSQGAFMVRAYTAKMLGLDLANIRAVPLEIGGGFGGKTVVYVEPVALALSRKAGRPVRLVMSREEVFRASGPTSGSVVEVKLGAKRDGTLVAAELVAKLQAGAFPGSPVGPACMCAFAMYDIPNVAITGYDVVSNRPKVAAYRAPGAPVGVFAVESALDELARRLGMDPIALRQRNATRDGTRTAYGATHRNIGFVQTLAAAKAHPHYGAPLGPNQGRGVAAGFWFNAGGESSAALHIAEDGTALVVSPNPDIGGSRASLAMMAAEVLGLPYEKVRPVVADTSSVPFSFVTGGSRVTFAIGSCVVQAAERVVEDLKRRAAMIWDVPPEAVDWKDGAAVPAGDNAGRFDPLPLAAIARKAGKTGGPIGAEVTANVQGAGAGFGAHICDVEVDPKTGRVTVLRYTAVQDVGKAIHPAYVEGQLQGGVTQGIGWALNEEYVYDAEGHLQNAGFLDYRMPVASDMPMIDTVLVEVANPRAPFGARGVGEVPIVPPLAAVANAVRSAVGVRMVDLPISPPKLLAALDTVAE
jgi:CO/xanthine dehydrogenase Mo-binding subunit/aerobic-type carbon monoxide dehydrogenase small subunit (CoxS/CutS family)